LVLIEKKQDTLCPYRSKNKTQERTHESKKDTNTVKYSTKTFEKKISKQAQIKNFN